VFVGVDAPEFNIHLSYMLRQAGIKTVQYVSPQVWAWRQYRVKKIAQSVDLMLTLFPFEADFYRKHSVAVKFVGHPIADVIPVEPNTLEAKEELSLPKDRPVIALLPGSRGVEVHYLADIFLKAAQWCLERRPDLFFVTPLASAARRKQFEQAIQRHDGSIPIKLMDGHSREVLAAADVVMLASGTATLETMLHKKPMVVAYRLSRLSGWIFRFFTQISQYALPNLLARKPIVPEFIQGNATPEKIGAAVLEYLHNPEKVARLEEEFTHIHQTLRKNASAEAARAIMELVEQDAPAALHVHG
jgi:lipid-A-disaccharide synthase